MEEELEEDGRWKRKTDKMEEKEGQTERRRWGRAKRRGTKMQEGK